MLISMLLLLLVVGLALGITGIASAYGSYQTATNVAISTAGAGTLTAASICAGVITRTGPSANFTDTTDTAAAIIAGIPSVPSIGQSWLLYVINNTVFQQTFAAGAGVTLSGLSGIVAANSTSTWLVTYSAAGAVTMLLLEATYNNAGGADPATIQTIFGAGTATFGEEGNINRQVPGVAAAVAPGATGADNVVAVYSLPANSFDAALRGITIAAVGQFAANANTKRVKLWWNPATAVVGSTVGAGGSLLADTGAVTTNTGGWAVGGNVFKRGAANANTQTTTSNGAAAGAVHVGVSPPLDATAVENAAILIAVTINNTTAVGDASLVWFEVNAMN